MLGEKLATERFYLRYAPLWIAVMALVMATRAFTAWRDLGHLLLGIGLAAPIWIAPIWQERDRPLAERHGVKTAIYITLLSFLQNTFGTPFFFRFFGLEYHFPVSIQLNGTPLFLSLITVAYFALYFALMQRGLRYFQEWLAPRLRHLPPNSGIKTALHVGAAAVLSYALALGETLVMATDSLRGYFAYGDKSRMMIVGSFCYGTLLLFSILPYLRIDEEPRQPTPLRIVVWQALGVNTLVLCAYEVYAHLLQAI